MTLRSSSRARVRELVHRRVRPRAAPRTSKGRPQAQGEEGHRSRRSAKAKETCPPRILALELALVERRKTRRERAKIRRRRRKTRSGIKTATTTDQRPRPREPVVTLVLRAGLGRPREERRPAHRRRETRRPVQRVPTSPRWLHRRAARGKAGRGPPQQRIKSFRTSVASTPSFSSCPRIGRRIIVMEAANGRWVPLPLPACLFHYSPSFFLDKLLTLRPSVSLSFCGSDLSIGPIGHVPPAATNPRCMLL